MSIFVPDMEIFYSNDIDDGLLRLDAEESGHCVRVLRHRQGDAISVIDGRGTLLHCTLIDADPRNATARIDSREPGFGAHPYRLTMAVCPTKNIDRYEWFAEKATEIGVDILAPVIGDRSERKVLKNERLERLVKSAAKQSLKGAIPAVLQPQTVRDFILGAPDNAVKMICYCFDGPKRSVADVLRERLHSGSGEAAAAAGAATAVPEICILIGPEGDFSPEEAELALGRGWTPVTLGASRLRTETAALVAATMVYSELG